MIIFPRIECNDGFYVSTGKGVLLLLALQRPRPLTEVEVGFLREGGNDYGVG